MLIDSRQLAAESRLDTSVCIVGGGPAGLTLAMQLAREGIAVSVFESGALRLDDATAALNEGENVGLPYDYAHGQRSRYLGGGSNCWGGFCRNWDSWDFEKRNWVPDSGWPISIDTLAPYYRRAQSLLRIQGNSFDADYWQEQSGNSIKRVKLDPAKIREVMTLFSPPLNFAKAFADELAKSELIKVYLWANAAHVDTESASQKVKQIEFKTLQGNRFFAQAQQFVLAAGGIENCRILLNSNRERAAGLGNQNDLLGRYFMDHPRLMSGEIQLAPAYRHLPFYDIKFFCISRNVVVNGTPISGQFTVPFDLQRREGLLNSQVWLRSLYPGETSKAVQSLWRMRLRAARRYSMMPGLGRDLYELLRHPLDAGRFAAAHVIGSQSMVTKVVMEGIVEPEPIADSRVLLSDKRDALGLRRARVDWRLTDRAKRTFDRSFELLGQQLAAAGVGKFIPSERFEGRKWPDELIGTWHHMGGTRMHDSPRKGVVDRHCRVHGINNLFIAGSSVFPTASSNYPTITLVALALRLAERLASETRAPIQSINDALLSSSPEAQIH